MVLLGWAWASVPWSVGPTSQVYKIKALCDLRPELVEKAQKTLVSSGMPEAATYQVRKMLGNNEP